MKVLITGGAGFIGSHLVEHFQGKAEVRVLDNLRSGFRRNLQGFKYEWIEGSILDRDVVRCAMQGVDYVFHLAAMISVPESMQKPIECIQINTIGLLNVLEEASLAKVKKLSLSSSAAIYGNNPIVPKSEDMVPEPRSPYAISKLDGEYFCQLFHSEGRLQTVSLRYFNVFGPRQNPNSAYAAAIPIFVDRTLKNEPITIYGDGEQTRDFIYVKDLVAANVHLIQGNTTGVFNVAYGKKISINALAQKICELTQSRSSISYLPERHGDVKHSLASVEKLQSTGFHSCSNFDEGLLRTIEFFRDSHFQASQKKSLSSEKTRISPT